MRVRLFSPLRDKVTSSRKPLVPWTGQRSRLSILTEPHDELAPFHVDHLVGRYSRNGIYGICAASASASLRLDVGCQDHLAPFDGLVGDKLGEIGGRARQHG